MFDEVAEYIASPDFIVGDGVIGKLGNDYVKQKFSGEKEVLIGAYADHYYGAYHWINIQ